MLEWCLNVLPQLPNELKQRILLSCIDKASLVYNGLPGIPLTKLRLDCIVKFARNVAKVDKDLLHQLQQILPVVQGKITEEADWVAAVTVTSRDWGRHILPASRAFILSFEEREKLVEMDRDRYDVGRKFARLYHQFKLDMIELAL